MLQIMTPPAPAVLYVSDAGRPRRLERALEDLRTGFARWRLAAALARLDIRNRYRGSVLGPFWLSLSTAVMVVALGLLYSTLFALPLDEYLPYLAVGMIVWGLISQTVTDACDSLVSAEGVIRQLPLPYTVHALRCVFRNAAVAAHSLPLIAVVFAACGHLPGPEALLAVPGVALMTGGLAWEFLGGPVAPAIAGSLLTAASMLVFLATVLRHGFGARAARAAPRSIAARSGPVATVVRTAVATRTV